ncbi:hypothetical protein E0K89_000445 [Aquicoccus sp. SCR17]|nr:hypothetical protein [Carideicomes alvinocaridis]
MTAPVLRWAGTLALAVVGAEIARFVGLTLPWMLGPLLITALFQLSGLRVAGGGLALPKKSRMFVVPILGIAIASRITPETLTGMWQWWPSLLAVAASVLIVQFIVYRLFMALGGYDRPTAFFAANPGGMIESLLMGAEYGGTSARIAIHHSARVSSSVLAVPLVLGLVGYDYTVARSVVHGLAMPDAQDLRDAAILAVAAAAGLVLARRLRLPAGILVGPFAFASVVYLSGWAELHVPPPLISMAQLVIGATVGAGFAPSDRPALLSSAWLSLMALAASLLFALGVAYLLHLAGRGSLPILFLAFAPGGMTEMSAVATALGLDPVFVATHHILRIVVSATVTPLVFLRLVAPGLR